MVYCGRPSRACENCRLRRLKCDQKRPACGPCQNTGRGCLGYRDANDIMFRDERERIIQKVQKADSQKTDPSLALSRPNTRTTTNQDKAPAVVPIIPCISEPVEIVAVNFLLREYLRGSHFNYLADLYTDSHDSSVLRTTVEAVGLACLGSQTSHRSLQTQAQKVLGSAITGINHSIQSCTSSPTDEILASVLLLSLYETLNLRDPRTFVGTWTTHVRGALDLVALRGKQQFQLPRGGELFKQVGSSIRVFCVQNRIRVPHELRQLTALARQCSPAEIPAFDFPSIVEAFTDLRADMIDGLLTEPRDVIRRAEEVLQLQTNMQEKLPASLLYNTLYARTTASAMHGNFFHTFGDHHIAQLWNTMWMAEIHLNSIIDEQLRMLLMVADERKRERIDLACHLLECRRSISTAAENICGTVPQFFHLEGTCAQLNGTTPRVTATGYFLIWPLFSVGSNPMVNASTKQYVTKSLERIASDLRLPQAQKAAEMLAQGYCEEDWMHMCHVF